TGWAAGHGRGTLAVGAELIRQISHPSRSAGLNGAPAAGGPSAPRPISRRARGNAPECGDPSARMRARAAASRPPEKFQALVDILGRLLRPSRAFAQEYDWHAELVGDPG